MQVLHSPYEEAILFLRPAVTQAPHHRKDSIPTIRIATIASAIPAIMLNTITDTRRIPRILRVCESALDMEHHKTNHATGSVAEQQNDRTAPRAVVFAINQRRDAERPEKQHRHQHRRHRPRANGKTRLAATGRDRPDQQRTTRKKLENQKHEIQIC